ncbi:MAG TPA: ABC transporter ATP-binding protein [Thermotogota bacterium]|nr:ABC transporter ATP-binding protein [Thermotogota bacterium]
MANSVLTLEKINKVYGVDVPNQVLFDIDLSIEKGSFNAIIGQSGSGKSTLLNIMGILDKPTNGTVTINGIRTDQMKSDQMAQVRNRTLGFIFQFHYLLPEFTALENVLMPYWIRGEQVGQSEKQRAKDLLTRMGLEKVMNNLSTKMSGGQQQRTAIARALMNQPEIILADEPTGNLDSTNTESVYELLREINRDNGTTFILVTHDRRVAEMADRIVEIRDGRVFLDVDNVAQAVPSAT